MTRVLFVCVKTAATPRWPPVCSANPSPTTRTPTGGSSSQPARRPRTKLNGWSMESLTKVGVGQQRPAARRLTLELQQAADVVVTVGEADVDPLSGPTYETWQIDETSLCGIDGTKRMRLVRNAINHIKDVHQRLITSPAASISDSQGDPRHG